MRLEIDVRVKRTLQGAPLHHEEDAANHAMLARARHDYPDQMLARVAVNHGDGTYNCDRPETDIYMTRVPVASPELVTHINVGSTVLIKFYDRDRRKRRIVDVAGGLQQDGTSTPPITLRGWWSQSEAGPGMGWLALDRPTKVWEPIVYPTTEILRLDTYSREEGDPPYLAVWGGTVTYRESEDGIMLTALMGLRILPSNLEAPWEYEDASKARVILIQMEGPVVTYLREADAIPEIGGSLPPFHLHHDPTSRLLIGRGSLSGTNEAKTLYVWRQSDGLFLAKSVLPWPLYQTSIAGRWCVKGWWTGDESGQTEVAPSGPWDDILVRGARRDVDGTYAQQWTANPKSWLGLTIQTDPPNSYGSGRPAANFQESALVPNGPTGALANRYAERPPYHEESGLAFWVTGRTGLDWGFSGYPSSSGVDASMSNPQDRAVAFDWDTTFDKAPHHELNFTREVVGRLSIRDPLTGEEVWGWARTIEASAEPTVDEDTVAPVADPDPIVNYYGGLGGWIHGIATYEGYATHHALAGGIPLDELPFPGAGTLPWVPYKANVPDYRFFRPHISGDQLGIIPNGPQRFNTDGEVLLALDEPYQIAVGANTPGGSVALGPGVSALGGGVVWKLTGKRNPTGTTADLDYSYWGVYQLEMWKKTFLRKVRADGTAGEQVWEKDLTIYSVGYTVEGTLVSDMNRPVAHEVKDAIFLSGDQLTSRWAVLREWSDPAGNIPQKVVVLEVYRDSDGEFERRIFFGPQDQYGNEETKVCLDTPPHEPPGEPPCDNYITLPPYAYKYATTVLEPVKGGVGTYFIPTWGEAWLIVRCEITSYNPEDEDHPPGTTFHRLVTLRWRPDFVEPDTERFVKEVSDPATAPAEGESSLQSIVFFDEGCAMWTDGPFLRGTFPDL